jgi:hypothetical protein
VAVVVLMNVPWADLVNKPFLIHTIGMDGYVPSQIKVTECHFMLTRTTGPVYWCFNICKPFYIQPLLKKHLAISAVITFAVTISPGTGIMVCSLLLCT